MITAQPLILSESTTGKKVDEIIKRLQEGVREIFTSGAYEDYLSVMSKFHRYSINNSMLIAFQKPDATLVAGFHTWKKNFDRTVKKGEKGIKILAPSPYKVQMEVAVTDGEREVKELQEVTIPSFKPVTVFDISQTEGKELPDLTAPLLDGVERYETLMTILEAISPVPIHFKKMCGDLHGYYSRDVREIAIRKGMGEMQTVKTVIHEISHALLHGDMRKGQQKDRQTMEVEAESVAYVVCKHFNLDTSEYSFGYIAGWSGDKEISQLKDSLETIRETASSIISVIEKSLN